MAEGNATNFYNTSLWGLDYPDINGAELRHSVPLTVVICVAYLAVFVVGVLGNVCVVLVVCHFPRMRSTTNLFIANLAIADLLVNVVCLPFTLVGNVLQAWVLGNAICRAVPFLQGVSVSASINTLVCISVERCLAICYPLRCQLSPRACRILIATVWAASLIVTLPWAVVFHLEPVARGVVICAESWPSPLSQTLYFALAHLSMCYLLPLLCISVCYALIWRRLCRRRLPGESQMCGGAAEIMLHRSKMKAVKMLLVVVVSFALSWMPLYVMVSRLRFGPPVSSDFEHDMLTVLLPFAQWLGTSNSCVNPIFYAYFNRKFRAGFMAILSSHSCCRHIRFEYDQCSLDARYIGSRRGRGAGIAISRVAVRRGSNSMREVGNAPGIGHRQLVRANTVCEVARTINNTSASASADTPPAASGAGAGSQSNGTLV